MAVMGRVAIVGAGPGAPDLLTRRAAARLRSAELVLYDALVDPRVLDLAQARAAVLRRQAGRPARDEPGGDPRPDDSRGPARAAGRAAQGRRPVRLRPRRRRGAGASRGRRAVRSRAGRDERRGRAGARGHPGHVSRLRLGLPRRERARPRRVRRRHRRRAAAPRDARRADGHGRAGGDGRAPHRGRLVATDAGGRDRRARPRRRAANGAARSAT